jgi:uncharacterized coiled-coil protein SlyX
VSGRCETILEMARRHVREGAIRFARQEEIVAELDRDNYPQAAALGRVVLETMRSSLDLMKRHLRAIEERSNAYPASCIIEQIREQTSPPIRCVVPPP